MLGLSEGGEKRLSIGSNANDPRANPERLKRTTITPRRQNGIDDVELSAFEHSGDEGEKAELIARTDLHPPYRLGLGGDRDAKRRTRGERFEQSDVTGHCRRFLGEEVGEGRRGHAITQK